MNYKKIAGIFSFGVIVLWSWDLGPLGDCNGLVF